jgi:F-type H+-transporting ATPase subunit gamma
MRLADIETRLGSLKELERIIGAMRALASMRVLEAEHALGAVRAYASTLATAITDALMLTPENPIPRTPARAHRALVLCTSEHGFVGGFNERLLEAAGRTRAPEEALFILGTRGSALAEARGWRSVATLAAPTRLASVPEAVRHLVSELYRLIARGEVERAEVMFVRTERGTAPRIETRALFPLAPPRPTGAASRVPPLHNLPAAALLEKLTAEYLFALLTEAATESLASENAARFNAMEAAEDHLSHKLEELGQQARQAHQEEVTTELLDVVAGAEAIPATAP